MTSNVNHSMVSGAEIGPKYVPDNVSLHFHMSPHSEARHLEGYIEIVEASDIIMIEAPGWTPQMAKSFTDISMGDQYAYEELVEAQGAISSEHKIGLLDLIKGTG
jgi:hypothetical protein